MNTYKFDPNVVGGKEEGSILIQGKEISLSGVIMIICPVGDADDPVLSATRPECMSIEVLEKRLVELTVRGFRRLAVMSSLMDLGWLDPGQKTVTLYVTLLRYRIANFGVGNVMNGSSSVVGRTASTIITSHDKIALLVSALFNPNAVHFFNHARPEKYAESVNKKLDEFRQFRDRNGLSRGRVMLDSSIVLEMYGIRRAKDIDYLSLDPVSFPMFPFSSHDGGLKYHEVDKYEMLTNPSHHFDYGGIRVVSFERLYSFKKNRGKLKDKNDIAMMRSLEAGNIWRLYLGLLLGELIHVWRSLRSLVALGLDKVYLRAPLKRLLRFYTRW